MARSILSLGLSMSAAVAVGSVVLAAPTSAAPERVPPWPSVRSAFPAGFQRPATTTSDVYLPRLKQRLDKRVRASALGGDVAVRVVDLVSAEAIYDHRGSAPMVPASTMKTAAALAVLSARGADHRLVTRAVFDERSRQLTIVGAGDPLLSSQEVDRLAADAADSLAETEWADAKLDIAYDDTRFAPPGTPAGWYGSYVGQYSANPTALTRYGSMSADSARDTGRLFRKLVRSHGVRTDPGVDRRAAPAGSQVLAETQGHTVAEAIWPMLRNSDNTIAEIMIRHVADARGLPTTTVGSASAVRSELARLGVPVTGMRSVDGSGLSRSNRITADTLVSITRAAMDPESPGLAAGFRSSAFPLAGRTGTLEDRFGSRGTRCAQGRILAKTGTLSDVLALSGVASSTDGRLRAFAIVVNGKPSWASLSTARDRVDRIAAAVTGCR